MQSLQQYLSEAGQVAAQGGKEQARELYRTAAKTYPTSKEPWLKLAEDYFEAANYGQAILASQEVLHRDPADSVATSMLAVSGLRVSALALSTLRQQPGALNGGAKLEAEGLAKVLRDALGEPVLVPLPTATAVTNGAASASKAKSARRLNQAPAASPIPATAATTTSVPAKVAMPANPFKVLAK